MDWWNTSFYFRRPIAISPDPLRPILPGHPIYVSLNHALYVAAGKLRQDFEDLAVVFRPLDDATPVTATPAEYVVPHKIVYDPDNLFLQVVFNAAESVPAVNYDYWLYFNNPTLTNVPETEAFVDSDYIISSTPNVYSSNLTFSRPNEDWINGSSGVINARAALTFYGLNARLKLVTGPDKGIVEVRVDEGTPFYINTYSSHTATTTVFTTSGLNVAQHYIRLRVTGEKAPSASNHEIELAAFEYSNYAEGTLLDEQIYAASGTFQSIVGP